MYSFFSFFNFIFIFNFPAERHGPDEGAALSEFSL